MCTRGLKHKSSSALAYLTQLIERELRNIHDDQLSDASRHSDASDKEDEEEEDRESVTWSHEDKHSDNEPDEQDVWGADKFEQDEFTRRWYYRDSGWSQEES